MSRRAHAYNSHTSQNPNIAPLPPRPRAAIPSSNTPAYVHSASPHSGYATPHMSSASHNDTRSPAPDHAASSSSASGPQVATTLFVGSISPGISDTWLTKLLDACGHLRSLKRASKAFAFAEYADPDSVLRAIHVLHARELPSMGADAAAPPKKLLVKADERTNQFLQNYQHTRVASSDDSARQTRALSAVNHIVRQMSDPNAPVEIDPSKPGYVVPDHLKDLPPEELPEHQRATVLSEIEQFRHAAAARDAETRRREAEFERQRAVERARRENLQAAAAAAASASSSTNARSADHPQSYRRPVDFHAASSYDANTDAVREPELADDLEEKQRQERNKAAARADAADAERAYLVRERQRLAHWEKEQHREQSESDKRHRDRATLLRRCQDWSDHHATRNELFYTDRQRWRQLRASARRREQQADHRDRAAEAQEQARAQQETEKFLAHQAAEMAKLAQQQRAAGVLVQQGGTLPPIKLNFASATRQENADSAGVTGAASQSSNAGVAKPSTAVLGEAEDDQHAKRTGRLKHIQLRSSLSQEDKAAKFAQLAQTLPKHTASLFAQAPRWEWVDEQLIQSKYRPWADAEIEESLGEKVDELVTVVIEGLQAHSSAQALVQQVEPVLAEEAETFVEKLWRLVMVDSLAAAEGILV